MDHRTIEACVGVAAGAGVLSHVVYFIRREHHKYTLQYIQALSASIPVCILLLTRFWHLGFGQAAYLAIALLGSYLVALWTSMIIYRAFFHRLNDFPGPWYLRLSKLSSFIALWKMDSFRKSDSWHRRYGNFVRTGMLTRSFRKYVLFGLAIGVLGALESDSSFLSFTPRDIMTCTR